jgi:DNA-binding NarL/FixJ family response regulator
MAVRIMLVDVQESVRSDLRKCIEGEPDLAVVGEAADGLTAIELVKKLRPDVVIMDVVIPKLDGIETTRRILKVCSSTKILAFSVHADRPFINAMFRAGAVGYHVKGRDVSQLLEAIRDVMNDRKYVSPQISRMLLHSLIDQLSGEDRPGRHALTTPELAIMRLLANGLSREEIAARLEIELKTVEARCASIMRKLQIRDTAELVLSALPEKNGSL